MIIAVVGTMVDNGRKNGNDDVDEASTQQSKFLIFKLGTVVSK